jgi:hypothetical protein
MLWILLLALLLPGWPVFAQHAVTRDWPMRIEARGQTPTQLQTLEARRAGLLKQRYTSSWPALTPKIQHQILDQITILDKQIAELGGPKPPTAPPFRFVPKPIGLKPAKNALQPYVPAAPWQVLMARRVGIEREIHFQDHDHPTPAHQKMLNRVNAQLKITIEK